MLSECVRRQRFVFFFLYFWIEEGIEYSLKTMITLTNYETVEVSNNREMHYMELLREANDDL